MNSWAIIITKPSMERVCYELPSDLDPVPQSVLDKAIAEQNVPTDFDGDSGWEISLVSAPVHPNTLESCTVIDWTKGIPE